MSRFIVGSLVVALVLALAAVAGARGPAAATSAREPPSERGASSYSATGVRARPGCRSASAW